MKTITCFICAMSSGGAEHQMVSLLDQLLGKGYNVELVTFGDIPDHYDVNKSVKRFKIAEGKSKIIKLLSIFSFFIGHKTDCVISFGQRENLFCLIPLIFRRKIVAIAGERNFTVGKPSVIEKLLFTVFYKRANYIVPNSYSQKDYILSKCPEYKNKLRVITNYTDLATFKYAPIKDNSITRIGIFCRYAPQKNYNNFARAIKKLKEMGCHDFVFSWFGNKLSKGEENPYYREFQNVIQDYQIDDCIELNDHISNVAQKMEELDAICVPSLHEGWCNTISEAICCGRPVLASDVSDNSRMVSDGINGFLFNPKDSDEMARAFSKFLSLSVSEKSKMGEMSRSKAEQLFNNQSFIDGYVSLIEG